jgi:hypothetical protein
VTGWPSTHRHQVEVALGAEQNPTSAAARSSSGDSYTSPPPGDSCRASSKRVGLRRPRGILRVRGSASGPASRVSMTDYGRIRRWHWWARTARRECLQIFIRTRAGFRSCSGWGRRQSNSRRSSSTRKQAEHRAATAAAEADHSLGGMAPIPASSICSRSSETPHCGARDRRDRPLAELRMNLPVVCDY